MLCELRACLLFRRQVRGGCGAVALQLLDLPAAGRFSRLRFFAPARRVAAQLLLALLKRLVLPARVRHLRAQLRQLALQRYHQRGLLLGFRADRRQLGLRILAPALREGVRLEQRRVLIPQRPQLGPILAQVLELRPLLTELRAEALDLACSRPCARL